MPAIYKRPKDLPTGDQAIEGYNRRLQKIVLKEKTRTSWGNLLQALREEAEFWASVASDPATLDRMSREKQQKMASRVSRVRERDEGESGDEIEAIKKQRLAPDGLGDTAGTAARPPLVPAGAAPLDQSSWERLFATLSPEQRAVFEHCGQAPCRTCGREPRTLNKGCSKQLCRQCCHESPGECKIDGHNKGKLALPWVVAIKQHISDAIAEGPAAEVWIQYQKVGLDAPKQYKLRNLSWVSPHNQYASVSQFVGDYTDEHGSLVERHTFKLVRTHSSQRPPSQPI